MLSLIVGLIRPVTNLCNKCVIFANSPGPVAISGRIADALEIASQLWQNGPGSWLTERADDLIESINLTKHVLKLEFEFVQCAAPQSAIAAPSPRTVAIALVSDTMPVPQRDPDLEGRRER